MSRSAPEGRALVLAAALTLLTLTAAPARAQSLHFGGALETNLQLGVTGCSGGDCRFLNFRNLNVLRLTLDAGYGAWADVRADLDIRNLNFSEIEELDDLGDADKVQPVNLRFREAHVTLRNLLPGIDLAVGMQRLSWGVADGVNPTDRLNPYDLEDPTRFERRLASPAVVLGWEYGEVRVEAAVQPLFVSAALPVESFDITSLGDPADVFDLGDVRGGEELALGQLEWPTESPAFSLENVQVAGRVIWSGPLGHFELSGYRGFDSIPQAMGEVLIAGFQTTDRVNLSIPLRFPRVHTVGGAWRGAVGGGVSAWVEGAAVFPERAELTVARHQLEQLERLGRIDEVPDPLPRMALQEDTPYPNIVAGLDYAIPDGPYLNLQYLYGFLTERTFDDLHHYALLAVQWPFLDGRLRLDLRGGVELADFDDGGQGWLGSGGVTWLHGDAVEVELAATFMGGGDRSTLQRFEDLSNVRLRVAVPF